MNDIITNKANFKFYRSYYEVFLELSDKDKVQFIKALLKKQFDNEETLLTGKAKLAYISQRHSIEAQVVGYQKKVISMGGGSAPPDAPPSGGGAVQEEKKEEKKEENKKEFISNDFEPYEVVGEEANQTTEKKQKEKHGAQKEKEPTAEIRPTFEDFWEAYDKKVGREQTVKIWSTMPHSEKQLAFDKIQHYKSSQPDKKYRKDPERYLKLKAFNNEIISNNDTANNSNNSFGQLPIGSRIANTLSMDSLAKSVARNMQRFAPQPEPTSGD